jgi:uncharacterized membrane-anchored protein YitT (DUF2179 family)
MTSTTQIKQSIEDIIYIITGIAFSGFALKSFLVPNHFFDGGVTGISLLIHELSHVNLALIIVFVNIPFIVIGAYQINIRFAFKTMAAVIGLGLVLTFIPYPEVTHDKLLVSIFGGFFMGLGIGLVMRAGCALDGIEVLAIYTWRRSNFTVSEIILAMNVIIFLVAAFQLGLETALYSMLTYFTASKTMAYVVEGLEEYTGVTIISGHSEEVKKKLVMEMGKALTIYKGERGFMKESFEVSNSCDIVFTVVTRLEVRKLKNLVELIDSNAFVFTNSIKEATGGILKEHNKHHHK